MGGDEFEEWTEPPAQKRRDLVVVGLRCNICNGKKEVDGDMVDKWW